MCVLVATRVDKFRRQKAVLADGATGVIVFSAVNSSDDVYDRRFETFADACSNSHHIVTNSAVPSRAQAQELVELHIDTRRRSREV